MDTDEPALRALPKVELHRHLDGSIRVQTILELAKRHNVDVGTTDVDTLARRVQITSPRRSLEEVLECFETLHSVLRSYEAIRRVAFENVEDAFRDGVALVELRFAPVFIAQKKDIGYDEIIEGVLDGVTRGMDAYRIQVGLIGIAPRALDSGANRAALAELIRYRGSTHRNGDRLYGFDLADAEDATDPSAFVPLVRMARDAGMGITVHSGENTSAEWVKRSLETFRPDRIGHGIKAWGDEEVLDMLRGRGTPLELCPTSNWLTASVPSVAEHPIRKLHDAGVQVCINSDDPNLMGIDLVHEYGLCVRHHGFTMDELRELNLKALEQSFVDRELKSYVRSRMLPG